MATSQFRVYAARSGPQKLVSSFPAEQERKALTFADKLFEDQKVSSIRVTLEMSDPATGRTRATTVVERNRDEPPAPTPQRAAPSTDGKLSLTDKDKAAVKKGKTEAEAAAQAAAAAAAAADEEDGGEVAVFGIDPATAQIAIKGASALAGAGFIGIGTYAASSSLLTGSIPNTASIAGATVAFLLTYVAVFGLLLSEQEARDIRQLFTPAPKAPAPKPAPKRKPKPAAAGQPRAAQRTAEANRTPDDPEFGISADRLQALQRANVWVITFLHQSLAAVTAAGRHLVNGRLDRSTSLACHLFFAGVCEGYAHERDLDHNELRWLIREGLGKIAFDAAGARNFALHYQEYLVRQRCFEMVRAGIEGIQAHLKGDLKGVQALLAALDRHAQKKGAMAKDDPIAVLFTKLVQDADAPDPASDPDRAGLVKTHDDIVRAALMGNAGREIRHMGDGIMGIFARAREAVSAAAEIQRFAAGYNARKERHQLHLRVGVNAGKPIPEAPLPVPGVVALAQRLASESKAEEILVSEAARTQAAGVKFAIAPAGKRHFRGFKEPTDLFSVGWRDDPVVRV